MSNSLSRRLRTTLFYALRTAFRLTPMPQRTRDRMRERFLDTKGHWVPEGPRGQAPSGDLPRRPYVRSDERAIGYVPYEKGELPDPLPATLVAFYLPQFHTIPENDEWWGKGFTEWRNVTRALPQFEGHYQPKLPGDLGFYDLRNVEVMHEQARLAREYGISAFCFYFYWFGGKTLLETPLRNWLNDKTIDLKFCLCWANEKWTRTWDGRGDEILIDQQHSPEDDIAFIAHVAEYMRDPRYLRAGGKPVLSVYRPGVFEDIKKTAQRWREYCRSSGIGEIHLAYVQSFDRPDPSDIGFDAGIEFPPNLNATPAVTDQLRMISVGYTGMALDWRAMATAFMQRHPRDYPLHHGINVGWDNEARKPGNGRSLIRVSPGLYRNWLTSCITRSTSSTGVAPLVFVNAWNEWAEGAILEPDSRYGYAMLKSTRNALCRVGHASNSDLCAPCLVIHAWHLDLLDEILDSVAGRLWARLLITVPQHNQKAAVDALRARDMSGEVIVVENRGRDILPFLRVANMLLDDGFELVLKLHTKKSPHIEQGDQWRKELLSGLASAKAIDTILAAFASVPSLGMVTADGHRQRIDRFLGSNAIQMHALGALLGLRSSDRAHFPSGSMFWARLPAIRAILEAPLVTSDFEDEDEQIDGTMAHAIERLFGVAVTDAGYELKTPGELTGKNLSPGDPRYPYARGRAP